MLQMEEAKAEVEKKLSTLTKLIENKNKIPKNTKKELVGTVNDLHEQCKLLYSVFHDLKISEREGPTRTNSDLYYFSSDEIEISAGETLNSGFPVMIRNEAGEKEQELTARVKELVELKRQVSNLKQETDYLRDQNMELAGDIEGKRNEDRDKLMTKDEVALLRNQKTELELELEKKTDEVSETRKRLKLLEEEAEKRVKTELKIVKEKENLLNKLQKLELDMSKEITEIDRLKEENQKLLTKIAERDSLLEEQKEAIDKFSEEQKLMKRWSFGSKLINTNLLERKMEELAEDFRMKMEDRIRILYRRVHVAEQIHLESKNDYIRTRDSKTTTQTQENRGESKVSETQFKKIKDMMEQGLAGPEMAIKKLEELSTRVTRLAKEVDSARKCVQEKKSKMKHEVETLEAKLECKEAQEFLLKEKLSKLEGKLAEEGTGKMSLAKAMRRIKKLEINVKEREVELLSLGEEKREAIRQLCVLVDYQRCRYDDLKTSIFKVALHA